MFAFVVRSARQSTALRGALLCALAAAAMVPAATQAATPAATDIDNQALLAFTGPGGAVNLASNRVNLRVQEVLDVDVQIVTPDRDVVAGAVNQDLTFRVTNVGNGAQNFDLTLQDPGDDDFDPQSCLTIIDQNLDGKAELTVDPVSLVTPILQPGQSVDVWASCSIPASAQPGSRGRIRIAAFPSGLQGRTEAQLAASGPGGVARIFGRNLRTGAAVSGAGTYLVRGAAPKAQPQAQLIKTQTVRDAMGGARAMPGSLVTYSLEARFDAGMTARKVRITDAIPTGASYVAGTMSLDGAVLTDADDGDAGRFTASGIDVALGDSPAASRTVTFQVRINPIGSSQ